jgi:CubicO group peptidase (beta-lactamase class C family)
MSTTLAVALSVDETPLADTINWGIPGSGDKGGRRPEMNRIDDILREAVARGEVAGVAAGAATRDGVCYEGAFGRLKLSEPAEMAYDSLFLIASMTKAVTSVAAMQLVERRELDLDADAGEILPGLANPRVLEGFDPKSGTPILRPAAGPVTPRQLLTHTSGLAYEFWSQDIVKYAAKCGVPSLLEGGAGFLGVPLIFDPGTRWCYGISTDRLGQIVERVSGVSLDCYFREHILGPLGMIDTSFQVPEEKLGRMASTHARQEDRGLIVSPQPPQTRVEFFSGGHGLRSNAPDYLRFLRMILNRGELDGARVLRPETVDMMRQNQIGPLLVEPLLTAKPQVSNDVEFFPEMPKKWGLGFLITTEPVAGGRAAGSLAWAGMRNSYYWIDPTSDLCGLLLTQTLPFWDREVVALLGEFEREVYA